MLQNIKSYLLFHNHYCGIEHTTDGDSELIHITILKKSKKELNIHSALEANSIEDASKLIKKNNHAFLTVNNENVITKKVESTSKDAIKLVNQAFPNININDFIYEVLVQNTIQFVSVCRKAYVNEIIETYKKARISIIDISLGNSIISNSIGFTDSQFLETSNANITMENGEICAIEKTNILKNEFYDINGLVATNKNILSLSAALTLVLDKSQNITNFNIEKQKLRKDFIDATFFTQFLKFGLIFIFSLLLVNFLIFKHYYDKVGTLEGTSQANQSLRSQIKALNEKVALTQKLTEDILKNSSSKSSYYINGIIKELPETMTLTEINYQPLIKRIKTNEPIQSDLKIIFVSGESSNSAVFSNWINQLESNDWLQKVEVIDYADMINSLSDFKIKIELSDDK